MIAKTPKAIPLFHETKTLIDSARQRAAVAVNAELTLLYWQVGQRIHAEVLKGERAEYGQQVIAHLAEQLTEVYGKGWSQKQLLHCLRFAETFVDEQIVSALRRQLSWTHLKTLIYIGWLIPGTQYLIGGRGDVGKICKTNGDVWRRLNSQEG